GGTAAVGEPQDAGPPYLIRSGTSVKNSPLMPILLARRFCAPAGRLIDSTRSQLSARARHSDSKLSRGREHSVVVADEDRKIPAEALRGGQVDRVEAAKPLDREQRRGVEQRVVDAHEIESFDDLPCPA